MTLGLTACAAKVDREEPAPQAGPPPGERAERETAPVAEPFVAAPTPEELEAAAELARTRRRTAALLLPLSGQHAALGEGLLQAAQLALFDAADGDFALIVRDTRGTPTGAREAAESALEAGAGLILGPLFASSVEAVTPVAESEDINVVAFSNDISVARPGVFIVGLLPSLQVERVVGFAASRGHRRFAALAPDSSYGRAVVQAMRKATTDYGAELTRVTLYSPAARDVSPEVKALAEYEVRQARLEARREELGQRDDEAAQLALKRLENRDSLGAPPFDAVLLAEGGKRLLGIAPLLPYYDVDPNQVQFLGTAQWNDPSLGTEPALVGGWFAAPPPTNWKKFRQRYQDAFGSEPPRLAALGYDGAALAAVLERQFGGGPQAQPFAAGQLTQPNGFAGVDGVFRLRGDGTVERRLAVLELRRNELRVLDPAPGSFEPLTE